MWSDELLDDLRRQADPEADAVVAEHLAVHGPDAGGAHLVRRVAGADPRSAHSGADDPVARYLADRPPLPAWADPARMAAGERCFEEWGPQILTSLLLASLPEAYAAANGVQVLHLTARLATDTRRRLVETTQMVIDVMTPGGLAVGAPGYTTVRRVRLMHAAVRHLIRTDTRVRHTCEPTDGPHWCEAWGEPINQEDLLGTLMTFTWTVLRSLERVGVRLDAEQAAAYLHAWNVVGHLLGIRPDLLPVEAHDAGALAERIYGRQQAPSAAGREMTAALLDVMSPYMRPRLLAGLPATSVRHLVGDRVADMLDVPRGDWTRVFFGPGRLLLGALSSVERHDRLLQRLTARMNRLFLEGFLVAERGFHRPPFAMPDHLADAWGVRTAPRTGPGGVAASGTG